MSAPVRQFIARIRKSGVKRRTAVATVAMGRERLFQAWDIGDDTFIFEKGISRRLNERPSVLIVAKSSLRPHAPGWVLTMSSGNHSVTAFPLLDGRFWKLSRLHSDRRGAVLTGEILCANVIGGKLEISQRDVPTKFLRNADAWLTGAQRIPLDGVIMGDRNQATLEWLRRCGQEWRVRPLVWTQAEMKVVLAGAKKRISSAIRYYHSTRGVHFLTYPEFVRFIALAHDSPDEFVRGLRELVSVFEGQRYSFTRMPKFHGHHEIELFGLRRGAGVELVVPELDKLMEAVTLGRTGQLGVIQRAQEIAELFRSLLNRPELADENSPEFVESLYIHITGEVYVVEGDGVTPAFDDRRTALPGASFEDGRLVPHPGMDDRTEVILSNLRGLVSKDERILYANVYELHEGSEQVPVGKGKTREVVYLTDRNPLEQSFVEKRLSNARREYGSYMLARVGALRSLGIGMSPYYRLLWRRLAASKRPVGYYIRFRCTGEPIESIPATYFMTADDSSVEEPEVVLALASLMGDAAAQNMAMKKYDPKTESPLFGVGKEIYEFEYDLMMQRVVPKSVTTCSIRGSLGWPCLERTEENLHAIATFYLGYYAHALKSFQARHSVPMKDMAERFLEGFEFRTHALAWQLSVMRDEFERFDPKLPRFYDFDRKWKFLMWSLDRQERRLPVIRSVFTKKVEAVENENVRNNPQ